MLDRSTKTPLAVCPPTTATLPPSSNTVAVASLTGGSHPLLAPFGAVHPKISTSPVTVLYRSIPRYPIVPSEQVTLSAMPPKTKRSMPEVDELVTETAAA